MSVLIPGVRLHDLPEGSVEERIRMAAELGFSCIQLPSKVLYASYGIDRSGLTDELADQLRSVLDEAGVRVAVFGCYKNLAVPDPERLLETLDEYAACLRFAKRLGADAVGTETGRPNVENRVGSDRFSDGALDLFCRALAEVCVTAEKTGEDLLIEPGWNEVVNTPSRCRAVLERVPSAALGVIYDPVSLLHPTALEHRGEMVDEILNLCGSKIRVLHAKDYEVVDNEDAEGWRDGSGSRLVMHGVGACGNFDFGPIAQWAAAACPEIPTIVENSTPATVQRSIDTLANLNARAAAEHIDL